MFAVALLCHCETIFIQTEITLTNVLSTSHVLRIGLSQPFSDFHILYSTEKAANTKSLFTLYLTENTITQQTTTQHARASWGTGRTQKCHTEMPLCGISNPQLCLQASLIVTVIPSSCFFFFTCLMLQLWGLSWNPQIWTCLSHHGWDFLVLEGCLCCKPGFQMCWVCESSLSFKRNQLNTKCSLQCHQFSTSHYYSYKLKPHTLIAVHM